jgi:nitrous oxidase accessory protein
VRSLLAIVLLLPAAGLAGAVLPVGGGLAFATLRQAIEAAQEGDTILVSAGTYLENNLEVNKRLSILGQNFPVIDGEFNGDVFRIRADGVRLRGLELRNVGGSSMRDHAAVAAEDVKDLEVTDCRIIDSFFGIHLSNCKDSRIRENYIRSRSFDGTEIGNGIHLWKSTRIEVTGNDVSGHRDGIYLEFATAAVMTSNNSHDNTRYGLHFMFSHDNMYRDNTFSLNGTGVAVMYSNNVSMIRNRFEKNWGSSAYALLLKDMRGCTIEDNEFTDNTVGIYVEGTSRSRFAGNNFAGNGWAVRLQASCDDNLFTHNTFTRNSFDMVSNGSLVLNTITENYWDRHLAYDLNRDGFGDVPYRPVSLFSMIVERMPSAIMLWRSFLVFLLDRTEKVVPAITPENLMDDRPLMKPYDRAG